MKITRKNYEAYFLDYRENNLTPEQVAELMVFLEDNSDLKEEFESYEKIEIMPATHIRFSNKEKLKKIELIPTDRINGNNYNEFIVADLEGDLSEDESIELRAFIGLNPKTKIEYNIYRTAFLKPDSSILFNGKEKLKKKSLLVIYRKQAVYAFSIAASIIILLGVYFGVQKEPAKRNFADSIGKLPAKSWVNGSQIRMNGTNMRFPVEIESRNSLVISEIDVRMDVRESRSDSRSISKLKSKEKILLVLTPKVIPYRPDLRSSEIASISKSLPETNLNQKEQKSFASRFIAGLAGKVIKTNNFKGKSFLEYTIDGYNLMADKGVILEKEVDKNGEVIAYSLNGENISFSRNRSQTKE
jgi:hypothetical protein